MLNSICIQFIYTQFEFNSIRVEFNVEFSMMGKNYTCSVGFCVKESNNEMHTTEVVIMLMQLMQVALILHDIAFLMLCIIKVELRVNKTAVTPYLIIALDRLDA